MVEKIAIEISNLSFSYEGSVIFNDLSLNIKENDLYAIIGPNGSGKTTLLKLILGLLTPQSGKILIY
ncbi:ATP-binding cassette domain-containing protein, partial [Acinetobacter baumannii]